MRSITRYVFSQLITAILLVTLGLTLAVWLTQSLRFIDYIVNRGLPASTFFSFVALLIPTFIGVVLPIACFVSVLFVYNKLATDSEVVVMRAAGLSQFQMAKPALLAGLVCTLVVYTVSLYFQPISYRAFKDLQHSIRNHYSDILLQEGEFNTITDDITVYIRERTQDGQILGILVHDTRNPTKPVTLLADSGAFVESPDGPRVYLQNGNRQEVDRESGRMTLLYFDSYTIELDSYQEAIPLRWQGPSERFLGDLLFPGNSDLDKRHRKQLIAEGHQRIVMPLYALVFVALALAAILGGEFNRRGQTKRIIIAVLVVVALEAGSLALSDVAAKHLEAVSLIYALAFGTFVVALWQMLHRPASPGRLSEPLRGEAPA